MLAGLAPYDDEDASRQPRRRASSAAPVRISPAPTSPGLRLPAAARTPSAAVAGSRTGGGPMRSMLVSTRMRGDSG